MVVLIKTVNLLRQIILHCSTDNDFADPCLSAHHYVPNYRGEVINSKVLPSGPWRGPTENVAGYAMQSFVDEMAHLAGQRPACSTALICSVILGIHRIQVLVVILWLRTALSMYCKWPPKMLDGVKNCRKVMVWELPAS